MKPEEVMAMIAEVREDFQGEEDQGLLQRDVHKAEIALAGKYACDRIQRVLPARCQVLFVPPKSVGRMR